ncbi:MAG: helix-turn-helix transcriptional regulator [Spirochaetaceae bacterium]|nr:helix-turn-helix transcriptional regulator [Spirochaetaceae bacterium]
MDIVNLFFWITAYSVCFLNIILWAALYIKYRNKIELFFLFVLCNVLLVTIVAMISASAAGNTRIFSSLLMNSVITFLITVPFYVYKAADIKKVFYWIIPIAFITALVLCNVFAQYNKTVCTGVLMGLFVLLFIPVFRKKANLEKNSLGYALRRMGIATFCIFGVLTAASALLFSAARGESGRYAASLYWAFFVMAYQVPSLIYGKNRLLRKRPGGIGLPGLTKREHEVAMKLYQGLKYEDIAKELFVSLSTVKKHAYHIYRKLGISNNRELMRLMTREKGQNNP